MPFIKELWANNAISTLSVSIIAGDTSIVVQSGDGALFPAITGSDYFWATLVGGGNVEVVKVTARSTDTLTVTRAQQSTSAIAWSAGTEISNRATEETYEDIRKDGEFSASFPITEPLPLASWSAEGQAMDIAIDSPSGGLYFEKIEAAAADVAMYVLPAPSTPYTFVFTFLAHQWNFGSWSQGICFRESGTSKIHTFGLEKTAIRVDRWTDETTYLSLQHFASWAFRHLVFFRIGDNGTNITYESSPDGINWILHRSESRTVHMAGGPDEYGIFLNASGLTSPNSMGMRLLSVLQGT
jgi:hypothetical protein